jgi:hypothetical protein
MATNAMKRCSSGPVDYQSMRDVNSSLIAPIDSRIKRNLSIKSARSWCRNCQLDHDVSLGKISSTEVSSLLAVPPGKMIYSNDYSIKSCNNHDTHIVNNAIDVIKRNILDIPETCEANRKNYCWSGGKGRCFGAHTLSSPRALVIDAIYSLDFHIHCYGQATCAVHSVAYTDCFQWRQNTKDIYICENIFSWINARQLACIIVHEIYHVFGADEHAATVMAQGTLNWGCP